MPRRPALASSDPLRILRSLALRGSPSTSLVGPAEPGRVGPTVAGLLGLMHRHGHEHARIRAWKEAGLVVCGQDDAEVIDGESARACLQALREAASLPAASPAGRHRVVFTYRPFGVLLGIALTGLTAAGLLLGLARLRSPAAEP